VRKTTKPTTTGLSQHPKGTRLSVVNGQLIVSTGLPDLDEIYGGGVPVGTLFLIEEDVYSEYAATLMKYFLAEGVACGHHIALASADESPEDIIKSLPYISSLPPQAPKTSETNENAAQSQPPPSTDLEDIEQTGQSDKVRIAWQYQKYFKDEQSQLMKAAGGINKSKLWSHSFDLSRTMRESDLEKVTTYPIDLRTASQKSNNNKTKLSETAAKCQELYMELNRIVNKFNTEQQNAAESNVLRIAIQSFASNNWGLTNGEGDKSIIMLLHALKGLIRQTNGICIMTVPTHFYSSSFRTKIEHIFDNVVSFEPFTDSSKEVGDAFKDFSGLFYLKKTPSRVNSLICSLPDQLAYTFKLKRKKLYIERIHLPPEISRTANKVGEDNEKKTHGHSHNHSHGKSAGELMCQPGGPSKTNPLDF
jgi:elongator complex protein 4